MKSILKRNRVLAVIALIGLLASLVPLISRVQAEESNKYYDIVLDYNSMRSMARQSSQSEDEWIDLFKSLGVDKVALSEASALNLHDNAAIPVHAMTVKKAAESYGWEDQYPAEVAQWLRESTDVSDAIIWTETAASYEWILNAFEARFEDFEAKTYLEGEHGFIFIQQQKNGMKGEKLLDLRLGIWPDTVELFERHGYQIIPRSVTEKDMNGTKFAEAYIEVLKHFNAPYFMNNGDELVGYEDDESLELLTQYLNESGASVAMMEQNDQSQNLVWPGIEELLDNTGYRGVRVFNEWAYIQNRYQYCGYEGPEEITNTFFRAIAERNCKIIFLKMILEPDTDVSHAGRGEVFRGRIDMRRAGFFETSYPFRTGYSVTVDGESVRPRRSAAGFLVVPLAAGNHEVQIDFLPPGYRVGLGISLLALLLFILQLSADWRGRAGAGERRAWAGRTERGKCADNGSTIAAVSEIAQNREQGA